MSDESFQSAWLTEFAESKLRAAVELAVVIGVGATGWYKWAVQRDTTTTEVFLWMAAFAVASVTIVWFHAHRVWTTEHRLRVTADDRFQPRPVLMLWFNQKMSGSFVSDGKDTPVMVENRGEEDAIHVHIEPVELADETVTFDDPSLNYGVPKNGGSRAVVPNVKSKDPRELETDHDLTHAVTSAFAWGAAIRAGEKVHRWPMRATYEDLRGRRFETIAALEIDALTRHVSTRFVSAGMITAPPPEPAAPPWS